MNALHHRTEIRADLKMPFGVVMIVHQGRDERVEPEVRGPVIEPIPENLFGFLGFKCGKTVSRARCDEIDRVVAIPMFEWRIARGKAFLEMTESTESAHRFILMLRTDPLKRAARFSGWTVLPLIRGPL